MIAITKRHTQQSMEAAVEYLTGAGYQKVRHSWLRGDRHATAMRPPCGRAGGQPNWPSNRERRRYRMSMEFKEVEFYGVSCAPEAKQFLDQCLSQFPNNPGVSEKERLMMCGIDALSDLFVEMMSRNIAPKELVVIVANAMEFAKSEQGSLGDAQRSLSVELEDGLAKQSKEPPALTHEQWVDEQAAEAVAKVEAGEARFTEHEDAKEAMAKRKAAIKARK